MSSKHYTLWLPVYTQGDDFDSCLSHSKGDVVESFQALAEQYKAAAELCSMVSVAFSKMDHSDISVEGMTHCISLFGPEKKLAQMLKDELIEEDDSINDTMDDLYFDNDMLDAEEN